MHVYIGFDISLQSTHVCAVDYKGNLVLEGVERSEVDGLDAWLQRHSQDWSIQRIVFDTGRLSTFLYHGLRSSWPVVCIGARHANGTLKAAHQE